MKQNDIKCVLWPFIWSIKCKWCVREFRGVNNLFVILGTRPESKGTRGFEGYYDVYGRSQFK